MNDDATALAEAIRLGRTDAGRALEASLAAARANERLGAVARLAPEAAGHGRHSADAPFAGVPTLVKDLGAAFRGLPARAGSAMIAAGGDGEDSDLARRFRAAGLVPFGLTTSPEFGLSLVSEPAIGPCARNPLDPALSPGGSSGGAAAAVAAGIVAIAHATDAGGSIRVPAACCGLVGLKPGRGSIPEGPGYGNHLGGIATELAVCRSVRDAQAIFRACAGEAHGPFPPPALAEVPGRLRIGLLVETGPQWPTESRRSLAVEEAGCALERAGHRLVLPDRRRILSAAGESARLFAGIVAVNLAGLVLDAGLDLGRAEPLTRAIARRGAAMSGPAAWRLTQEMALVSRDLWALFDGFDVLLAPMLAGPPPAVGSFPTGHDDAEAHFARMTALAPLAAVANISGFPALTLAFGADDAGLPLPVQMIAPMGGERLLLSLAFRLEAEERWQHRFAVAGMT